MRVRRVLVIGVLLLVIAGCGDDGPSLDEWADQADDICKDVNDDVDELDLTSGGEVAENGDDAVDIVADGIDDIEALDLPSGDDEQAAQAVIDSLNDLANVQEDMVAAAHDNQDDELALYQIVADSSDQTDEGADAADEANTNQCEDAFTERQESIEGIQSAIEGLGALADVRVGDCVTAIDDDEDLAPADCEGDDAEGSVDAIRRDEGDGCGGVDPTSVTVSGFQFCITSFGPGADEDDLLQIGSCALLQGERGEEEVDVSEFPCSDLAVTHVISQSVSPDDVCDNREDRRFEKTEEEIADSGPGEWCASPL